MRSYCVLHQFLSCHLGNYYLLKCLGPGITIEAKGGAMDMDDTGDVEEGGWGDDDALGGDDDDDEAGSEAGAGKGEAGGGWGDSDDDLDLPPGVATNSVLLC